LPGQRYGAQGILDDCSGGLGQYLRGPLMAMAAPTSCRSAALTLGGSKRTIPVGNVTGASAFGPDLGSGLFLG